MSKVRQINKLKLKWQSRKAPDFLAWCFGFDVAEGIVCVRNRDRNLYGIDSEDDYTFLILFFSFYFCILQINS